MTFRVQSQGPIRRRPQLVFHWIFPLVVLCGAGAVKAASPQPDPDRHAVEMARYLLRVQGDTLSAGALLAEVLKKSGDKGALAMAHAMTGEIAAAHQQDSLAAFHLKSALSSTFLSRNERNRLTQKLLEKDPGAIPALIALPDSPGPLLSQYRMRWVQGLSAVLEIEDKKSGKPGLWKMDSMGLLVPIAIPLSPETRLLDVAGSFLLEHGGEPGKLLLWDLQGKVVKRINQDSKVDGGRILNPRGDGVAWLTGTQLHFANSPGQLSEYHVEGPCELLSDPLSRDLALLLCSDQSLYRIEYLSNQVKSLGRLAEKPLTAALSGDVLLLQYADHIEVRRGPRFDAFNWGLPCQLQDRFTLGGNQAYLTDSKGGLRAFDMRTGQALWQKEMMAQEVYPLVDGVLVKTFAHALEALDSRGQSQWSYAFGWEDEPKILPWGSQVLLHFNDGRRVLIDRDVARAAQRPGDLLLLQALSKDHPDAADKRKQLVRLLDLEPGHGDAWRNRYALDKQLGSSTRQIQTDLIQAARSAAVPAWSNHPVLRALASQMRANWVFKREYGPKYYPALIAGHDWVFYVESDNRTLVIIDPIHGSLATSFRFSEELDLKVALWRGDTLCVSSPTRLYFLTPRKSSGLLGQYPLPSPVCQALSLPSGLLVSDWQGNLGLFEIASGRWIWQKKVGNGGMLMGKAPATSNSQDDWVDVTDLEGRYYGIQGSTGRVLAQCDLPEGPPIESQSLPSGTAIALSQGQLMLIGRQNQKAVWTQDLGEQIFSLTSNQKETLVVTTASKRVLCLRSMDGAILSEERLSTYLFNRPWVDERSFWLGTTEPTLERRNFQGQIMTSYALTHLPGSPTAFRNEILVGTLDHLIMAFPIEAKTKPNE